MISQDVRAVADAVLYEGYLLYPYRKSSIKNRQRWTFGSLFPRAYAERGGGDRWRMICECLVKGDGDTQAGLQLRFLQIAARRIARLAAPIHAPLSGMLPPHDIVDALEVQGCAYRPWDEAMAREEDIEHARLAELTARPCMRDFHYPACTAVESVADEAGIIRGLILRETRAMDVRLVLSAEELEPELFKLRAVIENTTAMESPPRLRDEAASFSCASSHLILSVRGGAFISLTDPPDEAAKAARECRNDGCWPVLAGADGATDTMLAAPIILYDYPRVAPESKSDLFDATEIDEILILRILTMTEAEKREMASGDPRARALLARLENMTPEELGKLHGAWREVGARPKPELASFGHGNLAVGKRVRLKPRRGGDVMDLALAGKLAVIEAIERDFEDRVHVAVVVDDDPGRDFGNGRFPGHRFFFSPDEIEMLREDAA